MGRQVGPWPTDGIGDPAQHTRVTVPVVEIAAHLRGEEDALADPRERLAQELFRVSVPVHVRRIEEIASQLVGAVHGAQRLGVVGGTVGVAEPVAADGPGPEPDGADREAGAAEHPPPHRSRSPSASGVATGSEQVVPTQTVAVGRSAVLRSTTLRGRYAWRASMCM